MQIEANKNLLLCREKGDIFWAPKNGELEKVVGVKQKIYYALTRPWQEKRVKACIKDVIENDPLDDALISKVARLSPRIFDRSLINREISDPIERVIFAEKLGVKMIPISTGANGSYFLTDWKGQKLFVFKPNDEEALSGGSPKLLSRIKSIALWLLGISEHPMIEIGSSCKNETLAYSLDKYLGTYVVPKTTQNTLYGKTGSCQEYRGGCVSASGKLPSIHIDSFQKMVVVDYAMGNLDRHKDNWLISSQGEVVAIDNGLSFGFRHPESWLYSKHQYAWKSLEIANIKFLSMPDTVSKLEKIEEWEDWKVLNREQKKVMRERIDKLIAAINTQSSPRELAKFKYEKDFS